MASTHKLRRGKRGEIIWPTAPIESTTARARRAAAAVVEAVKPKTAKTERTWTVTVACRAHRRSLSVEAATKPAACAAAIAQYRAETKMPAQTSVLVTECVPADPTDPEAA